MRVHSWHGSLHSRSFEIGLLIVCAFTLFLIEQVNWDEIIRSRLGWVTVPFTAQVGRAVEIVTHPALSLNAYMDSAIELDQLKVQHAFALAKVAKMAELESENELLRNMIGDDTAKVASSIIAAPIISYAYPAIGAGSSQGVRNGQAVISNEVMIGRITEVEDDQSAVQLLNSFDAQPVLVETDSGAQGIVKGTGKQVLLTQVLPDEVLTVGEAVVATGQPGVSPGTMVGVIVLVYPPSSEPTQTAVVDQMVSFYTTPLVEVR